MISIGDVAREIAKSENIEPTRENLQKLSERCFGRFGNDFFIKKVVEKIESDHLDKAVITSIRTPLDIITLKRRFDGDLILFYVDLDVKERFRRLRQRGETRDPKTWEEFLEQEKQEERIFHLHESYAMADYRLQNNGTLEDLFRQIDAIIERVLEVVK
jgi:dephospho-CoA kinase